MLQRLGLAQAMLHRPRLLILDEPTAGLDPLQLDQIRSLLRTLADDCALILATHLLDDVEQLCSRVVLLESGRIRLEHRVTPDSDLLALFRKGDDSPSLTREASA
jgi:ABC-2 type transport system ATP-binding protein